MKIGMVLNALAMYLKKYESRQEKIGKLKLILPELRLIAKIKDCVVLLNSKIQHACLSVFIRNSPFVV